MTVFISAGEASGDAYGAALVDEMRRLATGDLKVIALGGDKLKLASDELLADSSSWGVISITQSLKAVPRILMGLRKVPAVLRAGAGPGRLAIPIDFGFLNVRVARHAKHRGWKVLAFIPPGSWRRDRQASWAPEIYDAVSTPFPWSAELLAKMGTPNVHWFGHPIRQLLRDRIASGQERRDQIAVLPGSRRHELNANLPLIAASLPSVRAEFALARWLDVEKFKARWASLAPARDDLITVGDAAGVLLRSRAAIVCSGTATLEAALCHCPMAVIYRTSWGMNVEAAILRLKRPKYVALPNILLDRMLLDEFVGADATADLVGPNLRELLADGPRREAQLAGFSELEAQLGPDDAITRTAELALSMLSEA